MHCFSTGTTKNVHFIFGYFIGTSDAFQIIQLLLGVCTQKNEKEMKKLGRPSNRIYYHQESIGRCLSGSGSKTSIDDLFILVLTHKVFPKNLMNILHLKVGIDPP